MQQEVVQCQCDHRSLLHAAEVVQCQCDYRSLLHAAGGGSVSV